MNNYWNSWATDQYGGGWDEGSGAHKWAIKWVKNNFSTLKKLPWKDIYKLYRQSLVQD